MQVSAVAKAAKKSIVVAVTPGACLTPWRGEVDAVVAAFMPGQEYGNAVVDILTGRTNPSGKLPLTLPASDNQINMTKTQWPGVDMESTYTEGLLIGYRWCVQDKTGHNQITNSLGIAALLCL